MSAYHRGIVPGLIVTLLIALELPSAAQFRDAARQEVRGLVKSVDAGAGVITVSGSEGRDSAASDKTYTLGKNAELVLSGGGTGRGLLFKEIKLADLSPGVLVSLALAADQKTVESIVAEGPTVRGQLKAMDPAKNTLTIALQQAQREPAAEEQTYNLAADAEVALDDGRGRRFSVKEGKLADLAPGALLMLRLSVDRKQVQSVLAEGPSLFGVIKSVNPAGKSVTLTLRPARGDEAAEEKTLTVAGDAQVLLDDGRGRRLSVKEGTLADLPPGAAANMRLSADQNTIMLLRAEGPTLAALLRSVDPGKKTITIALPRGRGDAPEEKTYTLADDVRISLDGNEAKLADLKPSDSGPFVQLRLSFDQQSVQSVVARQTTGR